MRQLIYISTIGRGVSAAIVDPILAVSRRRNAADGVSGLLLFDGRRFLQALEGEAEIVQTTFDRIAADPRHKAIVTLSDRLVATREFGAWAMACRQIDAPRQPDSLVELVDALTEAVPDPSTRDLFRGFARLKAA